MRTHLESRLSGSMGKVISLSTIRPCLPFCLHRWCAASSVSAVRPLGLLLIPPFWRANNREAVLPLLFHEGPAFSLLSAGDREQGTPGIGRQNAKHPFSPSSSSLSYNNINISFSAAISLSFIDPGLDLKDES